MNTDFIQTISFASARAFVDYLDLTNDEWWNARNEGVWVFRGQGDAEWSLTPSAWRAEHASVLRIIEKKMRLDHAIDVTNIPASQLSKIKAELQLEEPIDMSQLNACLLTASAEYYAAWSFVNLANEIGFRIPLHFLEFKHPNLEEVIDSIFTTKTFVGLFGDSIALAQHHGIPTRLLDFSRKPRIAAYFAAESALALRIQGRMPSHIAVWAFNLDDDYEDILTHTCPHADHYFLHAQDGLFLYGLSGEAYFVKNGKWPSLVETVRASKCLQNKIPFRKITLATSELDNLLALLQRDNITRAHLMPSYDNVYRTLNVRWKLLDQKLSSIPLA